MKRLVPLSAALGGLVLTAGCQVSGTHARADADRPRADASVTVDRPAVRASADVGTYDRAYQASLDTPWTASPNATTAGSGTVRRGERVWFSGDTRSDSAWQQARLEDGTVRYVHPSDFQRAP